MQRGAALGYKRPEGSPFVDNQKRLIPAGGADAARGNPSVRPPDRVSSPCARFLEVSRNLEDNLVSSSLLFTNLLGYVDLNFFDIQSV
jgi:hypothetical protein